MLDGWLGLVTRREGFPILRGEAQGHLAGASRKLNMWPLREVYGMVAPFRSTPGVLDTRRS